MSEANTIRDVTIPELPNHYRGKVRENYDLPDGRRIIIATDRLSAFERIGVFGPPGINADQRQKLVDWMTAMHASSQWREILQRQGWDDAFLTGSAFDQFLQKDHADTEQVLREIGLAS